MSIKTSTMYYILAASAGLTIIFYFAWLSDVSPRRQAREQAEVRKFLHECFANGGSEFQYGTLGSSYHRVCVFKNPIMEER